MQDRHNIDLRTRVLAALLASTAPMLWCKVGATQVVTDTSKPASAERQALVLEEVVVTAQKVEENLQKTPVSVTVLGDEDLRSRGIVDPQDLQGKIPGVQFQPIGDLLVTVRGIGTFNLQPGVDSAVSYNVDGVYLAHGTALPPLMFDLERVEALRGPQGTLFGRNANAGAINFVTKKPSHELEWAASVTAGNYNLLASEGMINVPVSDAVALRFSGATQKHDGFLDDGHNDADTYAARLQMLVSPTNSVDLLASLDYSKQDSVGTGSTPCAPEHQITIECPADAPWRPFAGHPEATPDDFRTVKNLGVAVELDWRFDFAALTAISSYRKVDFGNLNTSAGFGYNPTSIDKLYTEEVRLNSNRDSPFTWVVGGYYSKEKLHDFTQKYFGGFLFAYNDLNPYEATSEALFGQVTYPLTDALRLTGGLRYTREEKKAPGVSTALNFSTFLFESAVTGGSEDHSGVTWKGGVEYDVSDRSLLYLSVSNGYKSGGVNQVPPDGSLPGQYEPEKITAYQVGSKNRFFNGRVQVNAELFYYQYKGFQTLASAAVGPIFYFYTVNSQRAKFTGGEIEAVALLTENDRFELSATGLAAEFTQFNVVGTSIPDLSGNRPANAPPYTINASYKHTFVLGNNANLWAQVDEQAVGGQWLQPTHEAGAYQKRYTQTSASVGFDSSDGMWGVTLWGRNLEDRGVMYSWFGDAGWVLPPRTFGLTVRVKSL